jgi:hypothetical protein
VVGEGLRDSSTVQGDRINPVVVCTWSVTNDSQPLEYRTDAKMRAGVWLEEQPSRYSHLLVKHLVRLPLICYYYYTLDSIEFIRFIRPIVL